MRHPSVLASLFLIGSALGAAEATPLPKNEAGLVEFSGVVKAPGMTSQQIYSNAKYFVARAFKSSTHVIKLDDQESGRLVVKGNVEVPYGMVGLSFEFTLTLEARSERYRWTIDQIYQKASDSNWTIPIEDRLNKAGVGTWPFKTSIEHLRTAMVSLGMDLSEAILKKETGKDEF